MVVRQRKGDTGLSIRHQRKFHHLYEWLYFRLSARHTVVISSYQDSQQCSGHYPLPCAKFEGDYCLGIFFSESSCPCPDAGAVNQPAHRLCRACSNPAAFDQPTDRNRSRDRCPARDSYNWIPRLYILERSGATTQKQASNTEPDNRLEERRSSWRSGHSWTVERFARCSTSARAG